jgi:UDP-N-acetyl-D-mannosaminuronate dehydrogenase
MGAHVKFYDPYVSEWIVDDFPVERVLDPLTAATDSDCVVLLQPHASFDIQEIVAASPRFLDTRGVTKPGTAERL